MSSEARKVVERIADVVAESALDIESGLATARTMTADNNPSGDVQLDADIISDKQLANTLTDIKSVGCYLSEERAEGIETTGSYTVAVDPLDGSKNIRSGNCAGIIVGVYNGSLPLCGRDLIGVTTVTFGSITLQTTAVDDVVSQRALKSAAYDVLEKSVELPDEPAVYGIGGRPGARKAAVDDYVEVISHELKCRYGGAMVADVNQVLAFGGVYGYPTVEGYPDGKLRGLVEVAPMAYIIEAAGGVSTVGGQSALEVSFEGPHERTPVLMGNETLIKQAPDAL
jgi:fructose-1,6-bisphosphatase I